MRKPEFCMECENCCLTAQRISNFVCFRFIDNTVLLLSKSEVSSLLTVSVAVQTGLCRTWTETLKTGFLERRINHNRRKGADLMMKVLSKFSSVSSDTFSA